MEVEIKEQKLEYNIGWEFQKIRLSVLQQMSILEPLLSVYATKRLPVPYIYAFKFLWIFGGNRMKWGVVIEEVIYNIPLKSIL